MKVSFILPVYNAEPYIRSSLMSTIKLMKPGDELIVVDDCSKDGSLREIEKLSKSWSFQIHSNSSNLGVAASLNKAISFASNEVLARMDADDINLPWRRKVGLRQIKSGADFGFSSAILFGPSLRTAMPKPPIFINQDELAHRLSLTNPFVHSTLFAKKGALTALGGYRNLAAEDHDLWQRAAEAGFRFSHSNIPTILYRVHPSQVTASEKWQQEVNFKARSQTKTLASRFWDWNSKRS